LEQRPVPDASIIQELGPGSWHHRGVPPTPPDHDASGTGASTDTVEPLERVAAESERLAERWLASARRGASAGEERTAARLHALVDDAGDTAFAMRFVDKVVRPDDHRTAAAQLAHLVGGTDLPGFLSPLDRLLLRAGARLAPHLPSLVMPLARRRMRALVGHLVVDAEPDAMADHFGRRRQEGFDLNVNLLGEAVLGTREADRRHAEALRLLGQPDVDYVSIKVSAIVPRLNPWDHEGSVQRVVERLRPLLLQADRTVPPTFVNLDMEEYHDLELTLDAFTRLLDEPELHHLDAGIALQAYLPDSFPALRNLVGWATERRARTVAGRTGGAIKVRLVKGANLAMERVDAVMHGWEQAPYETKAETDANYKRCLDWLLRPEHLDAVRVGVASHNLFDCAFAEMLSTERGVRDAVTIEMLEGMAPAQARAVKADSGGLLLYTPVVARADFDVAISYLFRRLEENTAEENFIRHLFTLEPGSERFRIEADRFHRAVADRWAVAEGPRRRQDRNRDPEPAPPTFRNEPDTDPTLRANRVWLAEVLTRPVAPPSAPLVDDPAVIDGVVDRARRAQPAWWAGGAAHRRRLLRAVGDELARRRGDLVAAMIHEANKTVAQADPEVSEAIDFARYYAERAGEVQPEGPPPDPRTATFAPHGVVLVVPPWNFPVAIPAGGVLAALAAGNAAILKPAPETPRCAEIVAECCWAAGIGDDVLSFVRTPDDETGRHLVAHPGVDAVILTGAYDTARLFRSWRPERPLLAETSGKNSLVITPSADIDLAVADLVASAFGHGGQKCSAASLAIAVDRVADSPRFRRQLVDAVTSLRVGPATDPATDLGPLIAEPTGKLERALTRLDPGEEWLVEPRRHDDGLWSPGVKVGVEPGSWFHRTECFGPVLGVVAARDLDHAIEIQNGTGYGLTGGLHSLDDAEVEHWLGRVEVGNAYVNRATTGAIVRRQPFGGWKHSSVGPGAKAGGPNYVAQLGRWSDPLPDPDGDDGWRSWLEAAEASDARAWDSELGRAHDPTGLFCEENLFRYRPLPAIVVRLEAGVSPRVRDRIASAARRCGVPVDWSTADEETQESFAARLADEGLDVDRVRLVGDAGPALLAAATEHDLHLATEPVTADGRRELLHYLREQAVSRTRHRYGNVL
jgi:RHH-type proline utilization regulon transcriptional repressor/proline dehydrogenase/delta 1-pyrroline-5-carboxylate dehydrogenase